MNRSVVTVLMLLALAACSTAPLTHDGFPTLQKDQGIAAIVFDTNETISSVFIKSMSGGGSDLYIDTVEPGRRIYLFVTPAGTYCLHQLHIDNNNFTTNTPDQCFEVDAGKVSYGGDYSAYVSPPELRKEVGAFLAIPVDHKQHMQKFLELLRIQYPQIAAGIEIK